jgi:fatty-acyl-CoA synthase/long-chain acyl-CoA synthetase
MLNTAMTMAEALRQVAGSHPDREALVCRDVRLTYGQLQERVGALACGLHSLGVHKGDKIILLLPPGAEFVALFFAVATVGAVVVPLSPQLRERRLGAVLRDAEPAVLIAAGPVEEEVLCQAPPLRHILLAKDLAGLMISEASGEPPASVSPHDLLALLYTSGTTGAPKGTMHTHRSLIAPVAASTKLRELWIKRPSLKTLGQTAKALVRYRERLLRAAGRPQTFLSTGGWHTITGLEVMLQALLMGDRLVVLPHFHPREALRLVEQERVTVLVAVPMAFQVMLGLQDFDHYDTSSLLICGTGAAPCPPHLAREMQRRFGCAVHAGFGATETAGGISSTSIADSAARQAETVGRPMPGMEVKIVDDERRELGPGQVGELACRGDNLMLGYYRAPDTTAMVMDEDGWYYTGDLALLDEKGYMRIVGRKKDLIIRGGQNVYPAEIETYLVAHPKIREAAVVGLPSAVGGESVCTFVLLEDGATMTSQEVLDYCRAELEVYNIPSRVCFVSEFPRSETGKPQKFKLREMALQEMEGGES